MDKNFIQFFKCSTAKVKYQVWVTQAQGQCNTPIWIGIPRPMAWADVISTI